MLPNFLIIGAAKSGTTALYHYLKQHPDIYMSKKKETNFFALEGQPLDFRGPGDNQHIGHFSITELDEYEAQFDGVTHETAVGEASPWYLYSDSAPERIQRYVPNAKLIAILRHPAERAFSHFLMFRRDEREPFWNFHQALEQEQERLSSGWEWAWAYRDIGFYHAQLQRYLALFDSKQIKICLYDDFVNDSANVLKDIYSFIGVDSNFAPDVSTKHNVSLVPKHASLDKFLHRPGRFGEMARMVIPRSLGRRVKNLLDKKNKTRPHLDSALRRELIEAYEDDILALQNLIGRDLSEWLR